MFGGRNGDLGFRFWLKGMIGVVLDDWVMMEGDEKKYYLLIGGIGWIVLVMMVGVFYLVLVLM